MTEMPPKRPPPAGWVLQPLQDTFSAHAGPFYFREPGAASGVSFFAESHHANANGVLHGGILMTLADMSLWDICRREIGPFRGATVSMQADFVGPGRVGDFIEAAGEMTKAGKSLLFARGLVTGGGASLLSYSGILKRIS